MQFILLCFRFTNFFGLRDFIHLVNYLRRETKGRVQMLIQNEAMRTELVLGGVQRNFNGHQHFDEVCKVFCNVSLNHYEIVFDVRTVHI